MPLPTPKDIDTIVKAPKTPGEDYAAYKRGQEVSYKDTPCRVVDIVLIRDQYGYHFQYILQSKYSAFAPNYNAHEYELLKENPVNQKEIKEAVFEIRGVKTDG